jgi:hypothetical protein
MNGLLEIKFIDMPDQGMVPAHGSCGYAFASLAMPQCLNKSSIVVLIFTCRKQALYHINQHVQFHNCSQ